MKEMLLKKTPEAATTKLQNIYAGCFMVIGSNTVMTKCCYTRKYEQKSDWKKQLKKC